MEMLTGQSIRICGRVENIVYKSDDESYCVCDIEDENKELFTAAGNIPYVSVGENVELYGKWTNHSVYGAQFSVERTLRRLPSTKNDILRYLSSGAVKGIGPKIAQKIVEQYGDDTFDVISNHPDWLSQIKGISISKAREISQDFSEKAGIRDIIMYCNDKFPPSTATKIYKIWGVNGVGMLQKNPYIVCEKIEGVAFKMADDIAKEHGISPDNENRIKCAIIHVLKVFAARDGHTYALKEVLLDAVSKFIEVEIEKIEPRLNDLAMENKIKIVPYKAEMHIYLKENYQCEEYISKKLLQLRNSAYAVDYLNALSFIELIEKQNGIEYAKMQKKAIESVLMNGVTVITGGPGTGKTTIVKALIQIFGQIGFKCALCAPTGRASQRLAEATSCEANTVHRLLGAGPDMEHFGDTIFDRNETHLLEQDVIIVDESSMMDVHITDALLRAIKPGARLVFLGDVNQLPSVGEGDVLNDIICSESFPVVRLNEIFRQAEQSGIVMNAHEINNGKIPDLSRKYDDFFFIEIKDEAQIPEYISRLSCVRLPKTYGIDPARDIQIITPTKKGVNGTRSLNVTLQNAINPKSPNKSERLVGYTRLFRVGDKIMQNKNDYSFEWIRQGMSGVGVFNGDVGIIGQIENENNYFVVDFDGRIIKMPDTSFDDVELAYAITVHKSQGSEYPFVIIPMTRSAPMLLTRNLLYTAITRAQRMVILVGDKAVFAQMVENDRQIIRNTGLLKFLRSNDDRT